MLKSITIALSLLVGSAQLRADQILTPEPSRSADQFADSVGVAVHLGYTDTMYGTKWADVSRLLGDSGIRFIRDSFNPRMQDLYRQFGIRAILITDPRLGSIDQFTQIVGQNRDLVSAIEGPNEGNLFWPRMNITYKGQGWPQGDRLFENDLDAAVKNDPILKDIPVIAPSSAARGANLSLAPLRSFDDLVMHSYPGGKMPSTSLDDPDFSNLRDAYEILGAGATIRPVIVTETGYHTCILDSRTLGYEQPGVSLRAQAKYIPRLIAEYFNAGVQRTVLYEFGSGTTTDPTKDPEACFGLLDQNAVPKPAYAALRDLIKFTQEAAWNPDSQQWTRPAVNPVALTFALDGAPPSVHHTLLQRSDGSFQLLLWNEVPSFDIASARDIDNPDVPVNLSLAAPADITVRRLGAPAQPPVALGVRTSASLQIPDEVIVVDIRPTAGAQNVDTPAPPAGFTVQVTSTSDDISWLPSSGADAYWVRCDGRDVGHAPAPGPDGRIHFTQNRLLPGLTYPYTIVAASRDGGVSEPAHVQVTTSSGLPDLIVSKLEIFPPHPHIGDVVSFEATVANQGVAPTENGVTIGVTFSVDGKVISWSDTDNSALFPGQQVTVKPDNGPNPTTLTWTYTPGPHRISALVDDVNRIAESDKSNNTTVLDLPGN